MMEVVDRALDGQSDLDRRIRARCVEERRPVGPRMRVERLVHLFERLAGGSELLLFDAHG